MMKNQLRRSSVLRATFLHESSSSSEGGNDCDQIAVSEQSGFTAPADDSATKSGSSSTNKGLPPRESEEVAIIARRARGSDISIDLEDAFSDTAASSRRGKISKNYSKDSSRNYGTSGDDFSSSSSSSSDDSDENNNSSIPAPRDRRFCFERAASVATISASQETRLSPHELAAYVALKVKFNFAKTLPDTLQKEQRNNDEANHDSINSMSYKDCIAPYKSNEIVLGPLLGSGEFSHVYEIKAFRPDASLAAAAASAAAQNNETEEGQQTKHSLTQDEIDTRQHMKRRERYRDSKRACYAVKHLRPKLIDTYTKLEYAQAASDLALEAEFLSNLSHPNIIKLRGISFDGAKGFECGPKGYFLIIDRLNDTLDQRIKSWKKEWKKKQKRNHLAGSGGGLIGKVQKRNWHRSASDTMGGDDGADDYSSSRSLLISEEQFDVGLQISSALVYLHENGIIFRDLKPQNVGFDVRGDVKLFDFGLAAIMPKNGDPYEDKFEMSGAGSPRYMAPEILVDPPEKYNMKADVYTFGIVLWEIFSMEVPYFHVKAKTELVEFVVEIHGRPEINEQWPEPIKQVLLQSFDPDMDKRPSIQLFYNMLRFQLLNLRDGDDTKLHNTYIKRRRSFTDSMRNLNCNDDDGEVDSGMDKRHTVLHDKFPQRVRNTFRLKPGAGSNNGDGQSASQQPQPQRKMRNKLRDIKFRLSVKHEDR